MRGKGVMYISPLYYLPCIDYRVPEPESPRSDALYAQMTENTEFFSQRFVAAFPGIREPVTYYSRREIDHRLGILLAPPLLARSGDAVATPLWWSRGTEDMYLDQFYRLKPGVILLDKMELKVSKLMAVPGRAYWQCFVYVECQPMHPTGLYPPRHGGRPVVRPEYEEFAVSRGRLFTRVQYDDGGYVRHGRVHGIKPKPQLRIRYLEPFNFLIISSGSPAHDRVVLGAVRHHLDQRLSGQISDNDLANWLLSLPRNR